jgi:formate hydrogenlyase subunit 3/multisubunit Na+/H+ antiporter MnhD subunit
MKKIALLFWSFIYIKFLSKSLILQIKIKNLFVLFIYSLIIIIISSFLTFYYTNNFYYNEIKKIIYDEIYNDYHMDNQYYKNNTI